MSNSVSGYLIPALGGTALVLGVAYGVANRNVAASEIELLKDRVGQVEARAVSAQEEAAAKAAEIADWEAKVAEIQAAAAERTMAASLTAPAPQVEGSLGLGRAAHPEEIAAWDVDILPDGRGLPPGKGDVWTGEEVFADYCGACHGDFAEGVDNWPVLAGGFDTLADEDPVKTVGSYWPHLSTVWDYVHRSMPFGGAQTLTDDEVYAIVAYILYSNDMVDDDFVLSNENFTEVVMHNSTGFVVDDRATSEYPEWRVEPCMEGCKDSVEITMRSSELGVTPMDEHAEEQAAVVTQMPAPAATTEAAVTPAAVEETPAPAPAAAEAAGFDPALVAKGEKVFKKCSSCHQIGANAKNKSGPQLTGVMGRVIGAVDGFKYSKGFKAAAEEGRVWDEAAMAAFLTKPKAFMKGTRMSFSGLKKAEDVEALIVYLKSASE